GPDEEPGGGSFGRAGTADPLASTRPSPARRRRGPRRGGLLRRASSAAATQRHTEGPAGGGDADRAVHHVRQRPDVPGDGPGGRAPPGTAGPHGGVPSRTDLLRADARQLRVRGAGARARAAVRRHVRPVPGGRGTVGLVRGDGPRRVPPAAAGGRVGGRADLRAVGAARGRAAGERRGCALPAPGHLPPDLSRPAHAAPGRPAAAPAAAGARAAAGGPAGSDGVLRLRRHVRGQERRRVRGDARRQVHGDHRHRSGVRRRRRQLVPGAHRRRAVPSRRARPARPLRRDPGSAGMTDQRASLGIVAARPFPHAARTALADRQLRANLRMATRTIRDKRLRVVAERSDWEALRAAGAALKDDVLARLPELLVQFEQAATAAGATVHWARDAQEACAVVTGLVRAAGADEVVKVKSMATQEIGLNEALARAGIAAVETDLAELIVQLADDPPSHILVPAIHYTRTQIRDICARARTGVDPALSDDPPALTEAARRYLRRKFLTATVAICGANFAVAETGSLVVVESEGNGWMC